jgi:hypothetical protein
MVGTMWLVAAVAAWIVGAAWALADARRRIASWRVPAAVGAVCFAVPVAGPIVWLLARPSQTLAARYEADLRLRFLERLAPDDLPEPPVAADPAPAAARRPEPAAAAV